MDRFSKSVFRVVDACNYSLCLFSSYAIQLIDSETDSSPPPRSTRVMLLLLITLRYNPHMFESVLKNIFVETYKTNICSYTLSNDRMII